jgi:hypothetical protein
MQTIEAIREGLIAKLMGIKDREYLLALNKLVSTSDEVEEVLDEDQLAMLEMSMKDIEEGKTISHEEFVAEMNAWKSSLSK